jgi:hypothetical protein
LALDFWRRYSPRRKRIIAIVVAFLLSIAMTASGVLTPLSQGDAQDLNRNLEETQVSLENMTLLSGSLFIFRNNFLIDLILFTPFAGPFFGMYVMHNTGLAIAAESIMAPTQPPPLLVLLLLFIFPFTWMEYLAYSIAFSESIWLAWRLIQRKGKTELINALILILVCLAILMAAAFVEMAIIQALV